MGQADCLSLPPPKKGQIMQEIFNFFNQGWVGSLIGIFGLIVATFFFLKSRRAPKPSYQKSSLRLLGKNENNLPDQVTVLFNKKEVDRLTKTTLIFWNNGNEVLKGEEVADTDPIKISFNEGDHILSYEKLHETKEVNEFSVSEDKNNSHQLVIKFSYLDPGDGISIELFHDSEDLYPKVHGSIMGLPKGVEDLGELGPDDIPPFNRTILERILRGKTVYLITMVIGLGMVVMGLFLPETWDPFASGIKKTRSSVNWVMIFLGLLYTAMPALALWLRRKSIQGRLKSKK